MKNKKNNKSRNVETDKPKSFFVVKNKTMDGNLVDEYIQKIRSIGLEALKQQKERGEILDYCTKKEIIKRFKEEKSRDYYGNSNRIYVQNFTQEIRKRRENQSYDSNTLSNNFRIKV